MVEWLTILICLRLSGFWWYEIFGVKTRMGLSRLGQLVILDRHIPMELTGPTCIARPRSKGISNALIKQENVLLKTHLWWTWLTIPRRLGSCIRRCSICHESTKHVWTASHIVRIDGSWNESILVEVAPLIITCLLIFYFSISTTLGHINLKILVSKRELF